jgi:transcriptional regulator with XRE-family HTH domain
MTEITCETRDETGASADVPLCNLAVFDGLSAVGVTGKEMAAALRVSTASVSKWRNGHSVIPDDVRVFLTLMLGDQLARAAEFGADDIDLDNARGALARQERLNGGLPAMAVREGARRYRIWWNAQRNASYLKPETAMRGLGAELAAGIR